MRRILLAALAATVALPTVVSAQSAHDTRYDQRDVRRDDRRDDRRDGQKPAAWQQQGQKPQQPPQRHSQASKPQPPREEWREHRQAHRKLYQRAPYAPPKGYRYKPVKAGAKLDHVLYARPYWVRDYATYRLPKVSKNQNYVRYGNDVLLVNTRTGRVLRVYENFFW